MSRGLFALSRLARLSWLAVGIASAPAAQTTPAPNLGASEAKAPAVAQKVLLIGGKKSHGPGLHDYQNGIPYLAALLRASPAFAGTEIRTYTSGFPDDLAVLQGASTVVLYFDGVEEKPEPLLDPKHIAALQTLMDSGTGLVALHQASTLPKGDTSVPLLAWLGAKRDGMFDRVMTTATLRPVAPTHPVATGLSEFTCRDEFYPTLIFSTAGKVTPLLSAKLIPESGDSIAAGAGPAKERDAVVAWAFERPAGGRAVGYTGLHFLAALDVPQVRQLMLNAIAWTARLPLPKDGVSAPAPVVRTATVVRHDENRVIPNPWGELRWYTSAEMGNSRTLTTGVAIIRPGQANPMHFHPNCDEVLHVISGRIRHSMNEVTVEMSAGDTVSIPQGILHNATNIGTEDAVLAISFSTAYREAVGYVTK